MESPSDMTIGQASEASGVSAKMIRYYESIGLLEPAGRAPSGYRLYGEDDLHTLRFVRRSRELGFSLDQIADLLALWRDRSRASAEVKGLAQRHIAGLKARIAEMQGMVDTLEHLAAHCHGDQRPDCPILSDLAEQSPCPPRSVRPDAPPNGSRPNEGRG